MMPAAVLNLDFPHNLNAADRTFPAAASHGATPDESFANRLNLAQAPVVGNTAALTHKAAAGLVADALILPLLKQIRRDPFGKNTFLSGGIGEKTFGPQFDIQLANRISESPNMALTQTLANELTRRGKPVSRAKFDKAAGLDKFSVPPSAQGLLDVHG